MWDLLKLEKWKSKSSSLLCDVFKKKGAVGGDSDEGGSSDVKDGKAVIVKKEKKSDIRKREKYYIKNALANNNFLSERNLCEGVDLDKQQRIMEWRRRGGKPRPKPAAGQQQPGLFAPSGSAKGGNAAGNGGGAGFGFGQQTNSVNWNPGTQKATSSRKVEESHTECKKREAKLKADLDTHVKYVEKQAAALQQMEQTIAYQYAVIQQMSQQIEAGMVGGASSADTSSASSSASSGMGDPLAQLTKQFEQMAGQGQAQGQSQRRKSRRSTNNQAEDGVWLK